MKQRWSNMMTKPLRTFLRRGALLALRRVRTHPRRPESAANSFSSRDVATAMSSSEKTVLARFGAPWTRGTLRKASMLLLVPIIAVSVSLSPLATRPANAQFSAAGNLFTSGLSSCAIETVGWVICPTMLSIAKLADYGFTYINTEFLKIDFSLSKDSSGTYKAWEIMRNIANGLFVVAFMILIYSQLTGRGGDYNMKRLVPRLIICAILVNLSYFLCSIMVEASNIVGDSLIEALKGTASSIGKSVMPIGATAQAFQDGTLTTITSEIMSKTAYAWVLLAPTAAVVISVATICAAGIVLLIMRKVIIAMLILASPILFVAYLLPNTERFFTQGSRLFIQLLLLYPIIALLLGAGQIVSTTVVSMGSGDYRVTGDSYNSLNGGSGSAITDLTAAAAAVLPLLGVWFLFKNMNSLMSTAGSRLSAAVTGRRGGKDDKDARVTGKATSGAAAAKNTNGVGGTPGRRQAFNRNRRRHSLGGSALTGEGGNGTGNALSADSSRKPTASDALQDALDNGGRIQPVAGMAAQAPGNIEDARLNGDAESIDAEKALSEAAEANQDGKQEVEEKDKPKTAKDIFNNLNRGHESKDKDRKFGAGPSGSGDANGGSGGGNAQPTAPATNYQAPTLAQNGNIVTGGAAAPAQIVAVPVQIDGASLLGGQSHDADANTGMTQPPISGTEEKAKARAQKYLFEANGEEGEELDVFGKKKAPEEPPHVDAPSDEKDDD